MILKYDLNLYQKNFTYHPYYDEIFLFQSEYGHISTINNLLTEIHGLTYYHNTLMSSDI